MPKRSTRRQFLSHSLAAGTSLAVPAVMSGPARPSWAANDEIHIAVLGCGVMGGQHIQNFDQLPGVRVVAVSDPDLRRMNAKTAGLAHRPQKHQDFRRILADNSIDAVVIASPNHWHSPMGIMACQAGKHAYVQKPVSHGIWEGRQLVNAARKYDRIVQAGLQHRSDPAVAEVAEDIQSGKFGKVQWAHCMVLHTRDSIGLVTQPQPVDSEIDYDLWCGPAPNTPVLRKQFHYDWHWQWNWGDGEMGNWGPHYIDDLRHILGWNDVPHNVLSAGSRLGWNDNGETPNVHFATFHHNGVRVVVDVRNLSRNAGSKEPTQYLGMVHGNVFMCEDAIVKIQRGRGWALAHDGTQIKQYQGDAGGGHEANFIDALRSGQRTDLNCEIEIGHLSTAMCHMANLSYRIGNQASVDEIRESVAEHPDAIDTLHAVIDHTRAHHLDLKATPLTLGPRLQFDPDSERFLGSHATDANAQLRYEMRSKFAIPEQV